jgi:hypothetical protein
MSVIDGQQLRTPWLSIRTATDPALLPPDLRPTGEAAVVVLVGSKGQMGDAFLKLQDRKLFELVVQPKDRNIDLDDGHRHPLGVLAIRSNIERVIRIDSTELNRWYLEQTSSPTLVPELGMILVLPWNPSLILKFDAVSRGFIHEHGHGDIHLLLHLILVTWKRHYYQHHQEGNKKRCVRCTVNPLLCLGSVIDQDHRLMVYMFVSQIVPFQCEVLKVLHLSRGHHHRNKQDQLEGQNLAQEQEQKQTIPKQEDQEERQ